MKKLEKTKLTKTYLNEKKEKNWDNRFTNLKIEEYDSYKDKNFITLGLLKAKLKNENYEEKRLKRAYSIRESSLNNNTNLNSPKFDFLSQRNIKNSLTAKKILKKAMHDKNFNNTLSNKKKKVEYIYSLPNSMKKERIYDTIAYDDIEKNIITNINKKKDNNSQFTLSKNKNFSFKENNKINNNKKFKNLLINELLIKIQADKELNELYINVKELWDNFGVTRLYQNNFLLSLNDFFLSKKMILQFLNIELSHMNRFKNDYSIIIKKMIKRNDEINNLKILINEYSNKDNLDQDSKIIEENIKNSLKLIRIYTINLVSQIKKFYLVNSNLTVNGKIDLSKIKIYKINFDYSYLQTLKYDLNFLKDSCINNLYNFNSIENDPFLISLSDISLFNINKNEEPNYEKVPITKDVYNQIIKLIFFLNEIEIYGKIGKMNNKTLVDYIPKSNIDIINNNNYFNDNLDSLNNEISKGSNYKGDIIRIINKLKVKNVYDKLFFKNKINNINKKKNNIEKFMAINIDSKVEKNDNLRNINKIKQETTFTTAEELQNKFKHYDEIKRIIEDDLEKK